MAKKFFHLHLGTGRAFYDLFTLSSKQCLQREQIETSFL